MEAEEGYLQVTGGKVWYKLFGQGAAGLPLVIVHGGPGGVARLS